MLEIEKKEIKTLNIFQRSSRQDVFCKNVFLRNFAKFTGKHLCQSLYFNEVADLRSATLLKKRLWQGCFSVNFAKFLRTPFLTEHLRWLLLFSETTRVYQPKPSVQSEQAGLEQQRKCLEETTKNQLARHIQKYWYHT